VTAFAVELGPADRGRLRAHLTESRRRLTAPLEQMDRCFFAISAEEALIRTPVTETVDAIIAAIGKDSPLRAQLPPLSRQDEYVISHFFEVSRDRAAGGWQGGGDSDVADAIERLRRAWDQAHNVHGDPGERAHLRTAAAWKPGKARQVRWAPAFESMEAP
jgi:hypothetical protein